MIDSRKLVGSAALAATTFLIASAAAAAPPKPAVETPLSMVNALHAAFGEHHARAVHTKGIMFDGTFQPSAEARKLTREPIFSGGPLPITARFSLFAGVPDLPDNDDGASPAGFAFKIRAPDGDDFDVESNQHADFITATFDEFAVFLRALGAAQAGDKAPLGTFLSSHPHAKTFLETRTYPSSFGRAAYFGVNALKFTSVSGKVSFIRYKFVPSAGEDYLSPAARKLESNNYLQDEIAKRIAAGPVRFDWFAQIAGPGDRIDDPSTAWPANRQLVKLGTITLTRPTPNAEAAQRTLLFLPGEPHPGVEAADPMLIMRNTAYPISLGQRQ